MRILLAIVGVLLCTIYLQADGHKYYVIDSNILDSQWNEILKTGTRNNKSKEPVKQPSNIINYIPNNINSKYLIEGYFTNAEIKWYSQLDYVVEIPKTELLNYLHNEFHVYYDTLTIKDIINE